MHIDQNIIIEFSKKEKKYGIGLLLGNLGTELQISSVPYKNQALIGGCKTLVLADAENGKIVFRFDAITPIVSFKCFEKNILLITEDCIYSLTYSGKIQSLHLLNDMLYDIILNNDKLKILECGKSETEIIYIDTRGLHK